MFVKRSTAPINRSVPTGIAAIWLPAADSDPEAPDWGTPARLHQISLVDNVTVNHASTLGLYL